MDKRETELNRNIGLSGSPSYQTSDDIRRRIDTRRAEMDVIADVLQEKLSPQHIAHQVRQELRGRTAKTVSSLGDSMKANPFPWMVMGLGLAWLVKESRSKSGTSTKLGDPRLALSSGYEGLDHGYATPRSYGTETYGYQPAEESTFDRAKDKVGQAAETAKEKVSAATETVKDTVSHSFDVAKEKVAQTAETAKEKMIAAKDAVVDTAHRAEEKFLQVKDRVSEKAVELEHKAEVGFWQAMEKNPLAVGAVALGMGLGIALAIPSTRKEEEVLGPLRERLMDRAKATGREAMDKVKVVANTAVEETAAKLTADDGNGIGLQSSPLSLPRSGGSSFTGGQQRLAGGATFRGES